MGNSPSKRKKKPSKRKQGGKHSINKIKSSESETSAKHEIPAGLKALCILSFIGFIYCIVLDAQGYFTWDNFADIKNNTDQTAYESIEDLLVIYDKADIATDFNGLQRLSAVYVWRMIFNVIAMVGTALMFYRLRKGYWIYAAGQILYVGVPFVMFEISALAIFQKGMVMIPLIYLALFTSQLKHLDR